MNNKEQRDGRMYVYKPTDFELEATVANVRGMGSLPTFSRGQEL